MTDTCSSKDARNPFKDGEQACVLAQAVVDSVREPLLVLDSDLRVISAGRSFYTVFQVVPAEVVGRSVFDLIDGRFNVPGLQALLKGITPNHAIMDRFEIEASFPGVGQRTLILNAREVLYAESAHKDILLEFEDVTERRAIEREKEALLKRLEDLVGEKEVLLLEMQHRVANSLQIIANILSLKARSVASEESRQHLQDAYQRVMSVATLQQHIDTTAQSRSDRNGSLSVETMRQLGRLHDRRPQRNLAQGHIRRKLGSFVSSREPGADCNRACHQCLEIRLSQSQRRPRGAGQLRDFWSQLATCRVR